MTKLFLRNTICFRERGTQRNGALPQAIQRMESVLYGLLLGDHSILRTNPPALPKHPLDFSLQTALGGKCLTVLETNRGLLPSSPMSKALSKLVSGVLQLSFFSLKENQCCYIKAFSTLSQSSGHSWQRVMRFLESERVWRLSRPTPPPTRGGGEVIYQGPENSERRRSQRNIS